MKFHLVDPDLPLVSEEGVPYLGTMCGRTVPADECDPPDNATSRTLPEDVCEACKAAEVDNLLTRRPTL